MNGGTRNRGSTWSYYFDLGKVDGKRKKKEKGGFRTKKEAEAALAAAINEYNNAGLVSEPSNITLSDYLDYWMENFCMVNLKTNTISAYNTLISHHIKPQLGKYRLRALSAAVIQKWMNQLKADGYSKSSVSQCKNILSGALSYAVHPLQYLPFNPCQQVRLPKFTDNKTESRFVIPPEDFQKVVDRFRGTHYYLPLMIGYYTGMRLNEIFALTWEDVDLKTKTSNRTIKFSDTLYNVLKDAQHSKNLNRIKFGENFVECYCKINTERNGNSIYRLVSHKRSDDCSLPFADMVCVKPDGSYLSSVVLQENVRRIADELGINFNFHSLRHTHATMLLENGASIKAVQERLGHASVTVTMDIYNHLTKTQENDAVNIFERISGIS